jgi:chaperone required for assembly of F1-ATPase
MKFTPDELADIKERTAQILAARIEEQVGDLAQYVVFPLSVASHLLSLSTKQVPVYLPLTKTAEGKHGVTLAAIKAHIETRTEQPKGIAKRKGGSK